MNNDVHVVNSDVHVVNNDLHVFISIEPAFCQLSSHHFLYSFSSHRRGRYSIKAYPTFLQLHGKTFDYKIPYITITRLFLLPHNDQRQMFFVVRRTLSPRPLVPAPDPAFCCILELTESWLGSGSMCTSLISGVPETLVETK